MHSSYWLPGLCMFISLFESIQVKNCTTYLAKKFNAFALSKKEKEGNINVAVAYVKN